MIDIYSWPTPNCHKVHIMLEETDLEHKTIPVNIMTAAQFEPDFLKINPNNKVPAIVDHNGPGGLKMPLFDSGAILFYLAEKTGKLMPAADEARYVVMQWLMFQMAHVGPMFGQAHHFRKFASAEAKDKELYAAERYTNESGRLYNVMDRQLTDHDYLAGDYSIADIAVYPWTTYHEYQGQDLAEFPNVQRWYEEVSARPAVQEGLKALADAEGETPDDEAVREVLFGRVQYQRR
jgi:GST-like protein